MSNPAKKSEVLEESKLFFDVYNGDRNLTSKLNSKNHLLPFTNGVYDLLVNEYRPTKANDYVELTVQYDYEPNVNNPEVLSFLEKILPDQAHRDYVLKNFSNCLNGDLPNTIFHFFVGIGANGKSQLLSLMKQTMGSFGVKFDTTLITRKIPDAQGPKPATMKLQYQRFGYCTEPEEGEHLNMSFVKELTGQEGSIEARLLNHNPVEFPVVAKFFLATNDLPKFTGGGEANERRVRVSTFTSRFVVLHEVPNPYHPNEFQADTDIPTKIKHDISWRITFMNILLEYYYRNDIIEPESVLASSRLYQEENNEIEMWCKENLVIVEDENILGEYTTYLTLDLAARSFYKKINPKQGEKTILKNGIDRYFKKVLPEKSDIENKKNRVIDSNGTQLNIKCWLGITLL
jgi:P4 family phage/plasmid primase-like protien